MTFSVFADNELIGTTQLESGDPPMGVAFGMMIPDAYTKYRNFFTSQDENAVGQLNLYVMSESGEKLEPCSGIGILDYSEEAGEVMIEVNVLGLDSDLYQKYFAHHV